MLLVLRIMRYIQRYHSIEVPDAAAKAIETSKRNHYGTVKDPLPLPPASVIPFVLETSGRQARAFRPRVHPAYQRLLYLSQVPTPYRNHFYLCYLLR